MTPTPSGLTARRSRSGPRSKIQKRAERAIPGRRAAASDPGPKARNEVRPAPLAGAGRCTAVVGGRDYRWTSTVIFRGRTSGFLGMETSRIPSFVVAVTASASVPSGSNTDLLKRPSKISLR